MSDPVDDAIRFEKYRAWVNNFFVLLGVFFGLPTFVYFANALVHQVLGYAFGNHS